VHRVSMLADDATPMDIPIVCPPCTATYPLSDIEDGPVAFPAMDIDVVIFDHSWSLKPHASGVNHRFVKPHISLMHWIRQCRIYRHERHLGTLEPDLELSCYDCVAGQDVKRAARPI
jgi:hypothetical protein